MKKIVHLLILLVMLPLSASALPLLYQEGVHYEVIADKPTEKPEVREFFSFYCPHCYSFEPFIKDLDKSLPNGLQVTKNHVDFLRAASPEVQNALTRAMIASKKMKIEDKVIPVLFSYIHKQRANFSSEKDILNILEAAGVERKKFADAMKSFTVKSEAKRMKTLQDALTRKRALTSVPTIIVNGKYKIMTEGLRGEKDFLGEYKKLVEYLLSL